LETDVIISKWKNVKLRAPLKRGGPKWRDNFPEEADHPIVPTSGILASAYVPLLLLKSLNPPSIDRVKSPSTCLLRAALRLPADSLLLQRLTSSPVRPRLRRGPSWRSFCSSRENRDAKENLILFPSAPPWTSQTSL